jgi:putative redox protein
MPIHLCHNGGLRGVAGGLAHVAFLMQNSSVSSGSRRGDGILVKSTRRPLTTSTVDEKSSLISYTLKGAGRGSRVDVTTNTGHQLATDVPRKMGGEDSAPQPVETLLAAWMGCTQATAVFVGRQMKPTRILIDRLEYDNIQAFRDERGAIQLPIENIPHVPSRLHRITGTVRVIPKKQTKSSNTVTLEDIQQLKEQTEARCPVANMIITSGCDVDVNWTIGI